MSHYIVQSAAACMPSSCKGRYRRVAVLEVEDGKTKRCAYERAHAAAAEMAAELNVS